MNYSQAWDFIRSLPTEKLNREMKKLAEEVEDDLLLAEVMPDDALQLFVRIFSCELTTAQRSSGDFVRALYNDYHKLSQEQRGMILRVFVENHTKYRDQFMRFSVADLISRKYSSEEAIQTFSGCLNEGGDVSKRFAYEGLDVIRIRRDVEDSVKKRVRDIQEKIQLD